MNTEQAARMSTGVGFVAALDQSGGSTGGALKLYGIDPASYGTDEQMFDLMHQMRARVMTAESFTPDRILAAILFDQTMDRTIEGQLTGDYLTTRGIVPIVKVDQGLAAEEDGVQLMRPLTKLEPLLIRAVERTMFGTKMRSVIKAASPAGIQAIVDQQFAVAAQILSHGLVPILEPEVDIHALDKAEAENLLKADVLAALDGLPTDQPVIVKLSIPTVPDFYADLIEHPLILRVLALSGGYSQSEACRLLAENHGLSASFSRALLEGLTVQQSDADFNTMLATSIERIYAASTT
ncbi:fructose bisphosphate aldolase [Cryobacterium breve]|uniref:fructose-bisphosphate aldolase n=1 Tax=Cryobacterium breve TaxID=1259258 RepID=A0ABY7NHJ6_9MICO|nr:MULTISPECIES: fructose bisphosphate aldolase [Cryobacterium]MDY7541343.1 fructose bisphosphate aldolase [Cryobacterium sp. 5B3]MEA9998143.1 fructose bisphosphate aldolase [Cryobacterium sp. RTS3]MEB0265333.1 fructose bisphosphate aldolase [Cryobacterium sp. 10I5]MEB0273358.1 fructose bisphosphate aldolase [Cryobacterium sp. 5B3]WBM81029.1 fructose bisphosphate aldolase [Cryobacterium breve]